MAKDENLEGREEILAACHFLQKLALKSFQITQKMVESIACQNANSLKLLDLQCCTGLDFQGIKTIGDFIC